MCLGGVLAGYVFAVVLGVSFGQLFGVCSCLGETFRELFLGAVCLDDVSGVAMLDL